MTEQLLIETAETAFSRQCTYETVQQAEADGWSQRTWELAVDLGLPGIGVPVEAGGSGGSLPDAIEMLRIAGRHAAPIPLAEAGILGGWALLSAGLELPTGSLTVVPGLAQDDLRLVHGRLCGRAHRVPWARSVEWIAAVVDGHVLGIKAQRATRIEPVTNVAGEPRDTVFFDDVLPDAVAPAPDGVDTESLRLRGGLSRVALIAGALDAVSTMTTEYTQTRRQFGRPLAAFQAVQAMVVQVAEEAALVGLVAQLSAREAERSSARFQIAAAKAVANNAVRLAARAAHQAHGAMGMTQEYRLHQFTRRLWAWRAEYGDATWATWIGRGLVSSSPEQLYSVIADGNLQL